IPACRHRSLTGTPASPCLRIETIWVSLNFDFFMEPPGWKDARKLYFWGVRDQGELTPPLLALLASLRVQSGRVLHLLAGWACLNAGLGAVVLVVRTRVLGMPVDYEGVLLLLMYVYGCGAMRLRTAVACGTTICVAYPLAEAWAGLPPDALQARTLFIVTTNVIGMVTAWILDQEARGNFLVARQLRGMAHVDFLTGLPNRRDFSERIEAAWQQASAERRPLA